MEHLLSLVSEEAPCGEYLKGNRTLYRGLRNTFNVAQSSFRQLIESPDATANEELVDANSAAWDELATQCEDTLQNTSKDVEVFCWLATAQLFKNDPLDRLANVLDAFTQSTETFWSDLNPKPPVEKLKATEEGGQRQEWAEHRIKPLLQLVGDTADSGLLYMPLQMIALIGGIDYSRYFRAERSGDLSSLKTEAQAAFASEKNEVIETIRALGRIADGLERLESAVNERCREDGATGVSFRFVKESVERLINALRYLIGDNFDVWPLDQVEETEQVEALAADMVVEDAGSVAENHQPESVSSVGEVPQLNQAFPADAMVSLAQTGEIYNRDQAFQELRKIADYFQRTEPHSPVYMLLERAIRWGYMSLPELLNEMVGDNTGVMGRITQMAGLESIEKTDIPEAQVSVQELMTKASSGVAQFPASSVPESSAQQQPISINMEPEQEIGASSSAVSDEQSSGSSISSFEW